jgi:hypothetical protein
MVKVTFLLIAFLSGAVVPANISEYPAHTPPVLSSGVFPCSGCHAAMEKNTKKRALQFHTEITIKGHAEQDRWCLDCHDNNDRDKLRLISGERVDFNNSHRLCGQCHGNIYRDWKAGVHGKRTGNWDGSKQYFLCSFCHNPHSPRFKPLAPNPVPIRPEETLRR